MEAAAEEVHFASCQSEKVCQSEMVLPTSSPSPALHCAHSQVLYSALLPLRIIASGNNRRGGEDK